MDVLPVHFRTFQIFGLWYEDLKQYWFLKMIHRIFVIILIFQFTFCQLITLFSIRRNVEQFVEGTFLMLTYLIQCYKMLNFIAKNDSVNDLLDKYRLEVCRPKNFSEEMILSKYQNIAKRAFAIRMFLTLCCGLTFFIVPIIMTHRIDLPFKTYFLDVSHEVQFVIAYSLQILPVISAIATDVCLDSTPCACIILTCGQLDLCCHRIISGDVKAKESSYKFYVKHHVLIQTIIHKVQSTFISIILPVFCSGLITLCTSIFQLAQKTNSLIEFVSILLYLGCLLCQTYYFCWFGNELQLKSETVADAIYGSDWTSLKPIERKNYWFIMFMGQNEIVISYHGQCALTLRTFIWMIKTSYGAFNLLQQVSKN